MKCEQFLILEITRDCNLGKFHPECPNRHPQRYGTLHREDAVSDAHFIDIAKEMYRKHGFRGRIGFHFYCEPTLVSGRMFSLMDRISRKIPEAEFVLWSNGTLLPEDCTPYKRFAEIHITDYRIPKHEAKNLMALIKAVPYTQVHYWNLDARLQGIGEEVSFSPCHRMFTEFVIDYWGNVHLCCYDWQGLGSIGNVHETPLAELVERWKEVRRQVGGTAMDPRSPLACLKCNMRGAGFTQRWIGKQEITEAAKDEVRSWQ